jgi:hypothetical protein
MAKKQYARSNKPAPNANHREAEAPCLSPVLTAASPMGPGGIASTYPTTSPTTNAIMIQDYS